MFSCGTFSEQLRLLSPRKPYAGQWCGDSGGWSAVVEGSVQRAADRTHVTVELNKHHWNEWRAADAKDHQDDFVNAMVNGNSGEIDRALQKVIDHAEAGARRPYDVAGF